MLSVPLTALMALNTFVLRIGRQLAWIALGLMVLVILIQVFYRYALNNALPWPDEAARFLMLWMTGLIAPSAYRWSGFVSIDMVVRMLPRGIGAVLALLLLIISLVVLTTGLGLSFKHVNSGWLFKSATLKLPLDWFGMKQWKMPLAYMYMSLTVGITLLISVNIELILRNLVKLFDPDAELPEDPDQQFIGAD